MEYYKYPALYAILMALGGAILITVRYLGMPHIDYCIANLPAFDNVVKNIQGGKCFARDNKYAYKDTCFVSSWSIIHFWIYAVFAVLFPNMWKEAFIVGTLFEFGEYVVSDCYNIMDIPWNMFGFAVGRTLSSHFM